MENYNYKKSKEKTTKKVKDLNQDKNQEELDKIFLISLLRKNHEVGQKYIRK